MNDFEIHFVQAGQGPHLVLLHGIGASVYCWRHIFAPLTDHFTVTALDLPGFGRSSKLSHADYGLDAQARRVLDFLESLNIDQSYLVGSSMGGAIALWLAKMHPDKFKKVATISPAIHHRVVPMTFSRLSVLAPVAKHSVNKFMIKKFMQRVVANPTNISDEAVLRNFEPYQNNPDAIATFLKATDLLGDHRLPEELVTLNRENVELLFLWGAKDRMTPVSQLSDLKPYFSQAQYRVHPTGGHHLMEDNPEWVVESLIQFFNSKQNL
ncbi:MAG: alpha/beta hydrolase [Bdellovibrionales bacterium]|nr:alpha/beta hydrolase [Bdellovibrionales bacterium]